MMCVEWEREGEVAAMKCHGHGACRTSRGSERDKVDMGQSYAWSDVRMMRGGGWEMGMEWDFFVILRHESFAVQLFALCRIAFDAVHWL